MSPCYLRGLPRLCFSHNSPPKSTTALSESRNWSHNQHKLAGKIIELPLRANKGPWYLQRVPNDQHLPLSSPCLTPAGRPGQMRFILRASITEFFLYLFQPDPPFIPPSRFLTMAPTINVPAAPCALSKVIRDWNFWKWELFRDLCSNRTAGKSTFLFSDEFSQSVRWTDDVETKTKSCKVVSCRCFSVCLVNGGGGEIRESFWRCNVRSIRFLSVIPYSHVILTELHKLKPSIWTYESGIH